MDRWLTVWRLLNLNYFTILFKRLRPLLDIKFRKTEILNLSVFALSESSIALGWWQVEQQVKNIRLLKITDFNSIPLFLSPPDILLRREFLGKEKNESLEIEMLHWYFSFILYKEEASGTFW